MSYDARAIANYFLWLGERDGISISPMKMQKLIYFAHGVCLATLGQPLVNETIEAWLYGPVIPSVYRAFREYGSGAITGRARVNDLNGDKSIISTPSIDRYPDKRLNEEVKILIQEVWNAYGRMSAVELSNLTHEPGTPWDQVYSESGEGAIPDKLMADWFATTTTTA